MASYLTINKDVYNILVKEKPYLDNNGDYLFREELDVDLVGKNSYNLTKLSRASDEDIDILLSEALY